MLDISGRKEQADDEEQANGATIDARPEVVLGSWMPLTIAAGVAILAIFNENHNGGGTHLLGCWC